jgi:hypothetical protein
MIKYVYAFKERPLTIKNANLADPQKIGEEVARIRAETKGRCGSSTYLKYATDKRSVLNKHLEWDDAICGQAHRLNQIRDLIGCLDMVEVDGKKEKRLPAFISLIERGGRSYHGVRDVMDSADLSAIALRQAENDLLAYEKRLRQFEDICSAIKAARELIAERRAKTERKRGKDNRPGA